MADQLLVRAYNVGCGDCLYVRIPGPNGGFHLLMDCGTRTGDLGLLEAAIQQLKTELPPGRTAGSKRLDLLVASHRHDDHIKGFDPRWFTGIEVRNLWLSAGMDPKHPQAERARKLRAFTAQAIRGLVASGRFVSPELELLAGSYGASNAEADKLLMKTVPAQNGIKPQYMHSGAKHGLKLPPETNFYVLGPEKDIDGYYLGEELDARLDTVRGLAGRLATFGGARKATRRPANVSASDFEVLRSRMLSNALAFVQHETSLQNNLSVVLLIEWKKRRLLFVADAEWEGEYQKGKHNGSWNVMWHRYGKTRLADPLDFLKIGHHGSINATPPPADLRPEKAPTDGVHAILDALLPVPKKGAKAAAQAIVSTERGPYPTIPSGPLLVDMARRIQKPQVYAQRMKAKGIDPRSIWSSAKAKEARLYEAYEKAFLAQPQPMRTDLEFAIDDKPYVDVLIPATD